MLFLTKTDFREDLFDFVRICGDESFEDTYFNIEEWPEIAVIGDFNEDLHLDLVALSTIGPNYMSILIGGGDGTFEEEHVYVTNPETEDVAVGDLNGDGHQDFVTPNSRYENIGVWLGNGDGFFQPWTDHYNGELPNPYAAVLADFDGDGQEDVVTVNYGYSSGSYRGSVSFLQGNGDGSFQPPLRYRSGRGSDLVVAGDFNGDDGPDVAVVNGISNTVSVFLNRFSEPQCFITALLVE